MHATGSMDRGKVAITRMNTERNAIFIHADGAPFSRGKRNEEEATRLHCNSQQESTIAFERRSRH